MSKARKSSILVIDDEPEIRQLLKLGLSAHSFEVQTAGTAAEGISQAILHHPDLIILDMGLPDKEGQEVIKEIRRQLTVPIVILSVRGKEIEKINALDAGADDYLTKPFGMGELMARIRVALRHGESENVAEKSILDFGDLKIDISKRAVQVKEQEVKLSPIEFDLLKLMAINSGKVMTHRQLLAKVWGGAYQDENHYLRIYMRQLRRKIEIDPARPKHILTESGVGYRLI